MNKDLMKSIGFGKQVDDIERGICPFCGKKINPDTEFRDKGSKYEYTLSGLCQKCQDETFGKTRTHKIYKPKPRRRCKK